MSELYHYGVKGMKWGVRKSDPQKQTTQGKRHLSLDEKGRIILTRSNDKVSKKAKQAFALRLGIATAASLGLYYLSEHPQLLNQTMDKINKVDRMAEIEKSIQESLEKGPEIVKKSNTNSGPTRFEPTRFEPTRFEPTKTSSQNKPKELSDFKFQRKARIDSNGKVSYKDVPVDKEGYADVFAKSMSKNKSDYDYWYKYIMNRMD